MHDFRTTFCTLKYIQERQYEHNWHLKLLRVLNASCIFRINAMEKNDFMRPCSHVVVVLFSLLHQYFLDRSPQIILHSDKSCATL